MDQLSNQEHTSSIQEAHCSKLISQLESWMDDEDSPFCIFRDYVDFEIYPAYREQIPVGMCLQTILDRLKHSYYTGYPSLEHDIRLIRENSLHFNGTQHAVTKSAEQLVFLLEGLICHEGNSRQPDEEENTLEKEKKAREEHREQVLEEPGSRV